MIAVVGVGFGGLHGAVPVGRQDLPMARSRIAGDVQVISIRFLGGVLGAAAIAEALVEFLSEFEDVLSVAFGGSAGAEGGVKFASVEAIGVGIEASAGGVEVGVPGLVDVAVPGVVWVRVEPGGFGVLRD